jgi:hypothetical protein
MKKLLLIVFLALALTACAKKDLVVTFPTTTAPHATGTLPSEFQIQQSEAWEEWRNGGHAQANEVVNCDACHQLQNGIATENIFWRNQETGGYESVGDTADLCQKCHTNYDAGQGAHAELTCLDCHDQHGITASCFTCHKQIKQAIIEVPATPVDGHPSGTDAFCEGSGCHSVVTQVAQMPPSNHGSVHTNVACTACHDGGGLTVGPLQNGSVWVPWLETEVNGEKSLMPHQSHNLRFEVDCSRCHFENNPWGLSPMGGREVGN